MHAILGCDTTSGICGIGMKTALKLASTNAPFRGYAQVFNDPQASMADLVNNCMVTGMSHNYVSLHLYILVETNMMDLATKLMLDCTD